jgi:MDMPI C-terminal domain
MFVPRQVRLGRLVPSPHVVELRATDAGPDTGPWQLFDGEGRAPDAVVAAPAATLLLLLWRRIPVMTDAVVVDGDEAAAREVLAAPLTP